MKVKEGQWIRNKYNMITQVNDMEFWFGVGGLEYEDNHGYIIDVSYNPRLLLVSGDLVKWSGHLVEVYVEEDTQDLYTAYDRKPILRNIITGIWCLDDHNDYIKCWWEEE